MFHHSWKPKQSVQAGVQEPWQILFYQYQQDLVLEGDRHVNLFTGMKKINQYTCEALQIYSS